MSAARQPTAALLVIGDEILSGRTQDTNVQYLAKALGAHGITLAEVRMVQDSAAEIIAALNAMRARYDAIFTSGGIGPTHDDITADSVAAAFGVSIDVHPDAKAMLENYYAGREQSLNEARLRMARIPEGGRLIANTVSGAPGFSVENVHVMAGVPRIFAAMVAEVLPSLPKGPLSQSIALKITKPEGDIAKPLGQIATAHPDVSFGSYPFNENGTPGTSVVARSTDKDALEKAALALRILV